MVQVLRVQHKVNSVSLRDTRMGQVQAVVQHVHSIGIRVIVPLRFRKGYGEAEEEDYRYQDRPLQATRETEQRQPRDVLMTWHAPPLDTVCYFARSVYR